MERMTQQQAASLIGITQAAVSRRAAANPAVAYIDPRNPRKGLQAAWVRDEATRRTGRTKMPTCADGLTIAQMASELGVTRKRIAYEIRKGRLVAEKANARLIVASVQEFERFKQAINERAKEIEDAKR